MSVDGSITKRKDGRWQGAVDIPTLDGKRKRKYVYARTRQECRKKVNAVIEEMESSGVYDLTKATFKECAEKWFNIHCANLSPTTIQGYRKDIYTYADKYIGSALIAKILPMHIQEMINDFAKNHSEKTCQNLLGTISNVFKFAAVNKSIKSNPCQNIKIPRDNEPYQYYIYDEAEYNKLLDYVTGTTEEIPILLAGLCGLRASEIMGLTWNDIDFENHIIHIRRACIHVNGVVMERKTKTRTSFRKIVAPAYVIERLRLYKGLGYVYPKKDGTPESGANFVKRFARMLKKAGLPHTRLHDLRHFNATMMLKLGISDKEAAARLGHSDTNMTKKYQHVLENMRNKPADMLDSIVRKKAVNLDVK
jgi:integrase